MSNLLLSKIGHVISEFPLAFKQTKEVKLFMTLLVKNEEGMLEENLQFHKAMGVDVNPEKPDVPLNKNDAFQKVQKRRVQEKR